MSNIRMFPGTPKTTSSKSALEHPALPNNAHQLRQVARYLLMRLNPAKEGDLAAILNAETDHAAVLVWLDKNQNDLDSEQCLIKLRSDILDRLADD